MKERGDTELFKYFSKSGQNWVWLGFGTRNSIKVMVLTYCKGFQPNFCAISGSYYYSQLFAHNILHSLQFLCPLEAEIFVPKYIYIQLFSSVPTI